MLFGYSVPQLRKGLIALTAAAVTIANTFGVPGVEDISQQVIAVFDALAAALVILVPNEPVE